MSRSRSKGAIWVLLGAIVVGAGGFVWRLYGAPTQRERAASVPTEFGTGLAIERAVGFDAEQGPAKQDSDEGRPSRTGSRRAAVLAHVLPTADDASLPAVTARPHDQPDPAPGRAGFFVPHPIDAQRVALRDQRQLFSAIETALGAGDFTRVRALLATHDLQYDEQHAWQDLREGYQLLVDCKQSPSDETRARGQRFVDERRGSTLRRAVRRACTSDLHAAR